MATPHAEVDVREIGEYVTVEVQQEDVGCRGRVVRPIMANVDCLTTVISGSLTDLSSRRVRLTYDGVARPVLPQRTGKSGQHVRERAPDACLNLELESQVECF